MLAVEREKNVIPAEVGSIHLTAVCGTAMGALACVLKDLGYKVTGSDDKTYPPMRDFLAHKNIPVFKGYRADNLSVRPDLVVVGNAVSRDNPEVKQMQHMRLPFCSMPQAVNRFIARDKKTLLITGTHGKTTTAAILAWVLFEAGLDPSFIVGGITQNFSSNYRLGRGAHVILEGDEYDTAFFDKGAKFLHYDPDITVLTSIEFDHADIFKDMEHVVQTFRRLLSKLGPQSHLYAYDDDVNIANLLNDTRSRVHCYGKKQTSSWQVAKAAIDPPWTWFEVRKAGGLWARFKTRIPGEHNLINIAAVVAAADRLGISKETIGTALETFQGVKRRQEIRGQKRGITVIDDFAHHPTAVRETLRALRPFCVNGRLVAVFEPRTNSSRRNVFQDVYPLSFDAADLICIPPPPLLDKIPPQKRFSSHKLVQDLKKRGKTAHFFPDSDAIIDFLVQAARPGDTLVIMSNGGFDNIHDRILKRL